MSRDTLITGSHADEPAFSPAALALLEQRADAASQRRRIHREPDRISAPLSASQQMLWLFTQLDPSSPAYNRPLALRLIGRLDHDALQRALTEIVRRHEVLRSRIAIEGEVPTRNTFAIDTLPLPVTDLSALPENARHLRVQELLNAEARRPFDLSTGPLLRAGILRASESDHTLIITTHHIASDGWSDGVLVEELNALYAAFCAGEPSPLPELAIQYSDFATWQRRQEQEPESERHAAYWREQLAGAPAELELPTDRARHDVPNMTGGRVTMSLRREVVAALESIGRHEGATLAMTMLAAFHLLLARVTGQTDVVVGLSIAGRTRAEVEGLIGFFSGAVPVRVTVDSEMTFRELLARVRIAMLEAHDHQDVPVDVVLDALPSPDGARRTQVSEALFNFRNMPFVQPSLLGLDVHPIDVFNGSCVTDLDLEVSQRGDSRECSLRYSGDLYDEATASRLLGHFGTLLDSIVASSDESVGRLSLLTADERHQILVQWNDTARELPDRLYLHEMIEAQVNAAPDAIALASEDGEVTYRELDRRANALARDLVRRSVRPGSFVGVCMERSQELMVSILAAWKAGAAFVPLDTDYPRERLTMMLEDSRPALVLADDAGASVLGSHEILLIDARYVSGLEGGDTPPPVAHEPDAIACVLYTSGSTGVPKGVLSTHRGIANNLLDMQRLYPLERNDSTLQQTSLGFDGAAWEAFWPLVVGARVYLTRPGGQRDPAYLVKVMTEQKISMFCSTPSVLQVMIDQPGFALSGHLRRITAIGEVLPPALQDRILSSMPGVELANVYGPTEASITVASWTCERESSRRSVPIGRPQSNVEIYILDAGLEPVPVGVAGEIYIGGVGVASGYLNRPALTAERFIAHPFRPESGERVYRTGDIARFDSDGVIEYIGRRDHQLKIRGVRVEPGEIEAALDRLPSVRESVVVAHEDSVGEKRLIAYVVLHDRNVSPLDLRRALENQLPSHFVPAVIIPLESMPRNTNGKIDRAALPDASDSLQPSARGGEAPRNYLERDLAVIWKDLLEQSEVGIHDSFFDLGGHSLLAVRMLQRVANDMGETVTLRALYDAPTIAAMAARMTGVASPGAIAKASPILRLQRGGTRPPLFYLHGQPAGSGRYSHALRDYMDADQPIYIVRTPIFDAPVTVEGVAAELVERIRAEEPAGPYLLAGNCFGAWLALEIARQLVALRESVPLVAIMHPIAWIPLHQGYRTMRRLAVLGGVPETEHVTESASAGEYVRRMATLIWEEQRRSSPRQHISRLAGAARWMTGHAMREIGQRVAAWSSRARPVSSAEEQAAANACHLSPDEQVAAHRGYWSDAWTIYKPSPYPGRVTMIWPAEVPGNPPWNPTASWAGLTPALDWRVVPGNHDTMMKQHFEFVAKELRACIAEVTQ
jgi:amino acid adenylation domain-containing protein